MDTTEDVRPARKASTAKTVLFFVVILLLLMALVMVVRSLSDSGGLDSTDTSTTTNKGSADTARDPVKQESGATGDKNASPSGTGPGSSNSLLGQP